MKCAICKKEIKEGEKAFQDNYFYRITCSYECHLRSFEKEFGLQREPNVYIEDGEAEYLE